jgi:hypothetical protein
MFLKLYRFVKFDRVAAISIIVQYVTMETWTVNTVWLTDDLSLNSTDLVFLTSEPNLQHQTN